MPASTLDRTHPLHLGSGSPRRRELLEGLGLPVVVEAPAVDEARLAGEADEAYLVRIVDAKFDAAVRLPAARGAAAVLVADTVVVVDGDVLGKPAGVEEARGMLGRLAGRDHQVKTRYRVARVAGGVGRARTVTTTVRFRPLAPAEIAAYAATGEGLDKAGAYAVQGLGAFAVERIVGSYANVVGLPVCEVVVSLAELGLLPNPFPAGRG